MVSLCTVSPQVYPFLPEKTTSLYLYVPLTFLFLSNKPSLQIFAKNVFPLLIFN